GNFYGTASNVVFRLSPSGSFTVLHQFSDPLDVSDAPLAEGPDRSLYGTTRSEPCSGQGNSKVFQLTRAGAFTVLATDTNAYCPSGSITITVGRDGHLYGTAFNLNGTGVLTGLPAGVVFAMAPSGAATVLHAFAGSDGAYPQGVIQASDGMLYGVT